MPFLRRRTLASLLLAIGLLAASCGGSTVTNESGSAASAAPGVLPTVGGGQLDFGDLEGQDTILWFWAPW